MTDAGRPPANRPVHHDVKNHLGVILGYCDLLLTEVQPGSRMHADLLEMRKAAQAAAALVEQAERGE